MTKRKCSNCHTEIEIIDKNYRSDLMFCSAKCHGEFVIRNSKRRKELGWKQLKESD